MSPRITIEQRHKPSLDELSYVSRHFRAYNDERGGQFPSKDLHLFAYDEDGHVIGGLFGGVSWGWLNIDVLWVAASHRRQGLGTALMDRSEADAMAMDVHRAYLETTDLQALEFYEQRGYQVFAQLDDQPPGHFRCYLKKRALRESADA